MKAVEIDQILAELSAGQWGLLTATQARVRGINRSNLAHREKDGRLERLAHGVYRQSSSPSVPLDDLRATWLSTDPGRLAYERTIDPDVVVGSAAAAAVHEIGDLDPLPYRLIVRDRRQTQRTEIAYSQRVLEERDVTVRDGLPVTTVERTIADLLRDYGDISLVADAVRDATRGDRELDQQRLATLLSPLAQRYGHPEGKGTALLEQLLAAAERDSTSQALRALENPVLLEGLRQTMMEFLNTVNAAVAPISESMRKAMPPTAMLTGVTKAQLPEITVPKITITPAQSETIRRSIPTVPAIPKEVADAMRNLVSSVTIPPGLAESLGRSLRAAAPTAAAKSSFPKDDETRPHDITPTHSPEAIHQDEPDE